MEHFKQVAQNWDDQNKKDMNQAFANAISKYLVSYQSPLRILDVGCGTGLLSQYYAENASELVGLDTTSEMLEQFDKKFADYPHVHSQKINLEQEKIDPKLGLFDVIMSAMTFHHLEQAQKVLKELLAHLKKNGQVFIIDLDKEDGSFHPDNKEMGVKHYGFSKQELESWANQLGLTMRREIVHSVYKNERDYPIFMANFTKA